MCGIVGVAGGDIGKVENAVFQDLLQVDVIRGPHSTGIAAVHKAGGSQVFKRALLPPDLFSMKGCKDVFNDYGKNIALIGHNRWATMGKINALNAHPFEFDTLVGCHNGTLRNKHKLVDHLNFETDSEALFHNFEKRGVEETIKEVDGAFALVWATHNDRTLHFLRNDDRPLWYTFSKDNESFFWASERWMLQGVLARHGVEHHEISKFEKNNHYTLTIPTNVRDREIKDFFMKEVEVYVPPKFPEYGAQNRNRNLTNNTHSSQTKTGTGNFSKDSVNTAKGTNDIVDVNGEVICSSKKRDDAGKSESSGGRNASGKSTKRTYRKGDICTFRVPRQTPEKNQRWVYGVDTDYPINMALDTNRIRVYLPSGSAVRAEMLADPNSWWEGSINGKKKAGDYVIQGNSVEPSELSEEELAAIYAAEAEDEKAVDEAWEEHVRFIESVGTCAWCSETLRPEDKNHVANSMTVFCPSCKENDDVKQFII
jgi:hypothetical protein